MADMNVSLGLNAAEYNRNLRKVEADAAKSGRDIARNLQSGMSLAKGIIGHQAIKKSFDLIGKSVAAFAKDNESAQRVVDQWEAVGKRISSTFGREFAGLMESMTSNANSAASWFERAYEGTTNFFADAMKMVAGTYGPGETAADVAAARRGREEMDRRIAATRTLRKEQLELQAAQASASGRAGFLREMVLQPRASSALRAMKSSCALGTSSSA